MMQTKFAILGVAAATALSGFAADAFATECTVAPLTTYLPTGSNAGCTVLDKTFAFPAAAYATTSGFPAAGSVLVTPLPVPNNPGLQFSANFGLPPAEGPPTVQFPDISLIFTVTARTTNPITDTSTTLLPASPAGAVVDDEFVNGS